MNQIKTILVICALSISIAGCKKNRSSTEPPTNYSHTIPISENSWISHNQQEDSKIIQKEGIRSWNGKQAIHTYFRTSQTGNLQVGLNFKSAPNGAQLNVSLAGKTQEINLEENSETVYVGEFSIEKTGYQQLTLEVVNPRENQNIEINELLLFGAAADGPRTAGETP